jgi:hypothetical protein
MSRTARWMAASVLLGITGHAHGGAFLLSDLIDVNSVSHPTGYTGTGGVLAVTVCIDPTSPNAASMVTPIQNAIAAWNGLTPTSPNLLLGGSNDIPPSDVDFESAALHEMGHCIGLNHPNLSTESGLVDPDRNYTKTTTGANTVYDLNDGADNVIGSSDDVRGDDVNVHWFRVSNNNPFTIAPTVDATTYSRNVASLPGGHLFVANADRTVGALLGFPDTEAVMQQGQFFDEAQRTLNHDDVATLRLGMTGLDMTAGTADDYTIVLGYGGMATGCDINAAFDDSQTGFAVCQTTLTSINATHWRISAANMYFNTGFPWFFGAVSTTTTTSVTTTTVTTTTITTTTTTTLPGTPVPFTAKKLAIKDKATDVTKRKISFISKDPAVTYAAFDPVTDGAVVHVFNSAGGTDSACLLLPSGNWADGGTKWTYKDSDLSEGPVKAVSIKNGLLKVTVKGTGPTPIPYTLDEPTQGTVGVVFASGGTAFCTNFGGTIKKDSGTDPPNTGGKGQFSAKDVLVAPGTCPVPPAACP